ncbi:MAG TPA: LD-carboxypeptidase [Candidatus Polarisedimenticolaceae bacterium]
MAGTAGGGPSALLRRGDRIAVVATGFGVLPDLLDAGLVRLRRMGFVPVPAPHARDVQGYLAGSDGDRVADLNAALRDADLAGVWFARGGYGTARILGAIDWRSLARHPKVFVGFSDLTAFFAAASRRAGARCLHGPTVADLATDGAWHEPSLRAALAGRDQTWRPSRSQVLVEGNASGPLVGGNLTVLAHLLGTRDAPRFEGAVLFLEEIGEEAYRVDRLLTHLAHAGVLERVAGVLLGHFDAPPARRAYPPDVPVESVLGERLSRLRVPVVAGVPSGHRRGKWTLPMGGRVAIDTKRRSVRFEPSR